MSKKKFLTPDKIMVCTGCTTGCRFKVVGLTGSWGKALCQICGKRQASLLIKSEIVDTERG